MRVELVWRLYLPAAGETLWKGDDLFYAIVHRILKPLDLWCFNKWITTNDDTVNLAGIIYLRWKLFIFLLTFSDHKKKQQKIVNVKSMLPQQTAITEIWIQRPLDIYW